MFFFKKQRKNLHHTKKTFYSCTLIYSKPLFSCATNIENFFAFLFNDSKHFSHLVKVLVSVLHTRGKKTQVFLTAKTSQMISPVVIMFFRFFLHLNEFRLD